ncbi:fatty-acyl-CoA synthase [Gordonia hydrophobica]|nr:fatty-acyl-CoA synthase [Gordonia hydrophobica]
MSESLNIAQGDRVLAVVPQFHAMAWGLPYTAFMVGASLILPDRFLQPEPLVELITAEKPTYGAAVATVWQGIRLHLQQSPADISSMREVLIGGSPVPPALMHAYAELGVQVLHAWGLTETSPIASMARPPEGTEGEDRWAYRYTQGRLPASVQARVVDDLGEPLPHDGVGIGEIEVRGPWVTGAYYGVDAPEKFHDGWLRTGDVGSITSEGFLTLTDRTKDIIKSGGEWISSVDLENAVMAHPEVVEAAVIGIPDERWDERPLVAVVVQAGSELNMDDLREFISTKVAKWQLPNSWAVVNEVPKTSVGKFDKKQLRTRFREGELDVVQL